MECYLIKDAGVAPDKNITASIDWLKSLGGGYVVSDLRKTLERALSMRPGEFDRYCDRHAAQRVRLTWSRGRGVPSGNVVAAFPTPGLLRELDESEQIERLMVLGWSERDWKWWADLRGPEIVDLVDNV